MMVSLIEPMKFVLQLAKQNMQEIKVFLILLLSLFIATPLVSSQFNLLNWYCLENVGNYTAGSVYQGNLNLLLHHLSTQASLAGFGTYTVGVGSDTVYGLYNCRRDLNLQNCQGCVSVASEFLKNNCSIEKEAITWYEECTLRYANRTIFSLEEESPFGWDPYQNDVKALSPLEFTEGMAETMDNLIEKAAYDNSSGGFAVANASISSYDAVYSLVQCTPDILGGPCEKCLRSALRSLAGCCGTSRTSGTMLFPSCQIRYGLEPFYNTSYRPPASSKESSSPSEKTKKSAKLVAVPIIAAILVLLLSVIWYIYKKWSDKINNQEKLQEASRDLEEIRLMESLQFAFDEIEAATNNFSADNKLGEGAFGAVYKGRLRSGQDVAVKRLFESDVNGIQEFKHEALVVGKLQHKNLVKLLGFCVEGREKLLVYELVPNASLDKFLFGPEKRALLDWETRYKIIVGIARGLMYLYEDSRQTIIHRDLKPANILLDEAMNPKIADFGTAKLFGADQIQDSTVRIVGTHGYMAPEYVLEGHISVKSDIYSFGVMILEIVSGRRCRDSLLQHAWSLWNKNELLSLVDGELGSDFSPAEVTKCFHIGLLCTQQEPEKRPTMSSTIHALNSKSDVSLPVPAQPRLIVTSDAGMTRAASYRSLLSENTDSSSQGHRTFTGSQDITDLLPR